MIRWHEVLLLLYVFAHRILQIIGIGTVSFWMVNEEGLDKKWTQK